MRLFWRLLQDRRTGSSGQSQQKQQGDRSPLDKELSQIIRTIKEKNGNSSDILIREITIRRQQAEIQAAVISVDGLANVKDILESLLHDSRDTCVLEHAADGSLLNLLKDSILRTADIGEASDYEGLMHAVLSGDAAIVVDGYETAVIASTREWKDRGVTEPSAQTVIRGPREGFSENLRTNTALIRRKIKDPNLWMEMQQIGRVTKTDVAMMYMKGIVDDKLIQEVKERLNRINIDAILESGYIEELIQDETFTPFPTIYNTERPDVVAAGLLEGRIAIVVDGTPFALLVPALFTHFFQTAEDYYQRADIGILLRILRYLALAIALLGPSVYIAITTFHQEMIPTPLLISIAAQREGVPFPALVEALLMEITFELLREAGVRMPRPVGQAMSIVGALVIGQSAVDAGLVGSAMVIVVSITAISNFVIPNFSMGISIRMIRFPLMILAAMFGLFGIVAGMIILSLHLCSLRSFGIPYMAPFAPYIKEDQKDNLWRLPHWALSTRPRLISQSNMTRGQNPSSKKPQE